MSPWFEVAAREAESSFSIYHHKKRLLSYNWIKDILSIQVLPFNFVFFTKQWLVYGVGIERAAVNGHHSRRRKAVCELMIHVEIVEVADKSVGQVLRRGVYQVRGGVQRMRGHLRWRICRVDTSHGRLTKAHVVARGGTIQARHAIQVFTGQYFIWASYIRGHLSRQRLVKWEVKFKLFFVSLLWNFGKIDVFFSEYIKLKNVYMRGDELLSKHHVYVYTKTMPMNL